MPSTPAPGLPPRVLPVLAGVVALQLSPAPARADWPFAFVQITCAPELHYVAVRRMIVENAAGYAGVRQPHGSVATQQRTEKRNGIFASRSLAGHPATCVIPDEMTATGQRAGLSVAIGARVDLPGPDGARSGVDEVTIDFAGKPLAAIWMDLKGQSQGVDSAELYANGAGVTVRICSAQQGAEDTLTCKSRDLPPTK